MLRCAQHDSLLLSNARGVTPGVTGKQTPSLHTVKGSDSGRRVPGGAGVKPPVGLASSVEDPLGTLLGDGAQP